MAKLENITAAYNFIPLNKEVYKPSWSDKISHDMPFFDSVSGEIDIKIIAKSPLFIKDNTDSIHSCNFNGNYYIPGSSIKGMIRNIVEVISFSKLKLQDKTLSYRDLNHPSYKKKAMDSNKIYMGWLSKNNFEIKIESVGKITSSETRIKYKDMKKYLDSNIVDKLSKTNEAYKKYDLIKKFDLLKTEIGTIVFTGKVGPKKTKEFLFPNKILKEYNVSTELFNIFKEAYYLDTPNESADWKNLWAKKFEHGEKIPVFFQLDSKNNIKHFGLSMLYKLPYENSLQDILEKYQDFNDNDIDLAEAIFGYVKKDGKSLKSRVQFSHFKSQNAKEYEKSIFLPLSSPRATFYPNYLVQNDINGKVKRYVTYDNQEAILRGYKFYPPKKKIIETADICQKNPKVCSEFKPLKTNCEFVGKVKFHNLTKVELGSLVAAITFFGNEDKYFHKLGKAKAYGFGTVSLKVLNCKVNNKIEDISKYQDVFTDTLNKELKIDLLTHPRIKALFKLSSYFKNEMELQIMDLRDFAFAKKHFNMFALKEIEENSYDKKELFQEINTRKKNRNNNKPDNKNINFLQKTDNNNSNSTPNVKEYPLKEIAKESGMSIKKLLEFIKTSTLPISKKLNEDSILKEAQAKGLINQLRKSR